ncbi:MAG: DnaJ domain-containing protein [Filomicrobium sp.]
MHSLLIGLVLLALVLLATHGFVNANPGQLANRIRKFAGAILLVAAAALMFRGAVVAAIPAAMLALWLFSKSSNRLTGGSSGQTSEVKTEHLEMELDHDSGEIRGRVIKGIFEGRRIEKLRPAELALLWQDVRIDDPASAQLIEAYLDRIHPTWRDDMARGEQEMSGPDGRMTKEEAYEILGLQEGASDDEIRRAHKQLMLKMHPDRGGSTYLASKINEAKDVLLGL